MDVGKAEGWGRSRGDLKASGRGKGWSSPRVRLTIPEGKGLKAGIDMVNVDGTRKLVMTQLALFSVSLRGRTSRTGMPQVTHFK